MKKQTLRTAAANVAVNLGLTVLKLLAGFLGNSSSLISDGVHSGADVLSSVIAMLGVRLSQNGPDEKHQYGHESFECIASMFLSIILLCAGIAIGYNAVLDIISGGDGSTPSLLALIAAIISIIAKTVMCYILHRAAKKSGSLALKAEVWHLRTDVLASSGCLLGIIGARFGLYFLDPAAAIIVSLLVIRVGFSIMRDSINKITDHSCDADIITSMEQVIRSASDDMELVEFKTRISGSAICADVVLCTDGKRTIGETDIAREQLYTLLKESFSELTCCTVCIVPIDKDSNRD